MKKRVLVSITLLALALIACGTVTQVVVVVTATPEKVLPTPTIVPTITPRSTPIPLPTPTPTQEPVTLFDVEQALVGDGWKRAPYYTSDNTEAYAWTKDSAYKRIYTYASGHVGIEVLNTSSRLKDMEQRFKFLDTIFPADFMAQLREQNKIYDSTVGKSVSGEPDWSWYPPQGSVWNEYQATFNTSIVTIGSYKVAFRLYVWKLTCPPQYSYCYFSDFPGLEWSGDTAFTWYTIDIQLPNGYSPSTGV